MNLSFLPGELVLNKQHSDYVVTLQGQEMLRTRSEKEAFTNFNELRRAMEAHFPAHVMTAEQKRAALQKWIGDALVSHNGDRHQTKKIKSGSTRTFG